MLTSLYLKVARALSNSTMKYISTRKNNESVSFKEAVINGLSNNGGLYFPESIPQLPQAFFNNIEAYSDAAIAFQALKPFVEEDLSNEQLKAIIAETLTFPTPTVPVEGNMFALELFHGPTQAFKDVGARFMSRCLSQFYAEQHQDVTILVATSGDTGSAVANGFYNVPGVQVKILFPKGKISPYQEFQMTSLGKNIQAIEVEGVFDDCQQLVKQAFNDQELRKQVTLSSANSINIARLLPQMLYYFLAYKQLKPILGDQKLVVSVPSGNLGNLTAGLIAQQMGLPITHFVAALNANDTFLQYLNTGSYTAKPSVATYSNAMDVGNPSNFERIAHLFQNDLSQIKKHVSAFSINDAATLEEIKHCYAHNNYVLDPHGAVAKLGLAQYNSPNSIGVFLGTAHPQKFAAVIQKVVPVSYGETVDLSRCKKVSMRNDYEAFKDLIKKKKT